MMNDQTKFKIIFALLAICIAHFYPNIKSFINEQFDASNLNTNNNTEQAVSQHLEREIINSWKNLVYLPNRNKQLKIAIGINTNVDLILSGTKLLKNIDASNLTRNENEKKLENHQIINNLDQFKECYKYFFRKGSAAERSFTNSKDFDLVLDNIKGINKEWFIGGNAGLMAQSISKRFSNSEILLIGPIGPKLKKLLNNNIKMSDKSLIEKDEIHLILEYGSNEEYDGLKSPSANRFIVSHDIYNSRMEMLDEFFKITNNYNPDIMIFSGLHLLQSQDNEFRTQKLRDFKNYLSNSTGKNVIHLELASIGDMELMQSIIENDILKEVNSLGLNEQELLFLAYSNKEAPHSNYYIEINGQPDLVKVVDIIEWVLNKYGSDKNSKFTRIHFHCLLFHIIAEIDNVNNKWSNSVGSLMSGSKIAAKQACGFDFHDEKRDLELENLVEFRLPYKQDENKNILFKFSNDDDYVRFNMSNPVIEFKRSNIKFYFTPVLVCKTPLKTVGLGDAISSNGILYAHYNHD